MALSASSVRLAIYVLVFASGFSGLVYEVIWVRMLHTILGCTTHAVCLVLSSFMAGLAIGSFYAGRFIEDRTGVLRIYALIEAGIGVFALLSPILLGLLDPVYVWLHGHMSTSTGLLHLIRFLLAFITLIVPTVLMGATLPIMSQFFVKKKSGIGSDIGGIYGFNTLGATLGCFLAGFLLIEAIGIRLTIILAALLNLAVALIILINSRRFTNALEPSDEQPAPKPAGKKAQPVADYSDGILRLVLVAFALSGFVSIGYEVLWFKAISFFAGNTSYAFSTMLTTFLFGIGLGSVIATRFCDRLKNLITSFGIAEVLIGLSGIASIAMFAKLFHVLEPTSYGGVEATPVWLKFTYSFFVMLLPTMIMGAIFPMVSRIYTRGIKRVGRSIGDIYSVNTIAGIFGSAVAGFLLIPTLGIQQSILLLAIVNMIIGMAMIMLSPDATASRKYKVAIPAVVLALVLGFIAPVSGNVYTSVGRPSMPSGQSIYYEEGVTHIAEIIQSADGTRHLILDGGINASTAAIGVGNRVHMMMAQLPLFLHDSPRSMMLIALGSGMTSGATLAFEELETIDCAEISPDVVRAASYFTAWNHDIVNADRFNLHIEDGRNFVLTTPRKYDVITTGIIHPKHNSGNASLYSKDYYKLCKSKLNDGGLVCQWAPLNGLTVREFKMILRTFLEVFPESSLWFAQTFGSFGSSNALLIGGDSKLKIDFGQLAQKVRSETVDADLKSEGIESITELLDCFVFGSEKLREYLGDETTMTTDDKPLLEFGSVEMHFPAILAELSIHRESVLPYLTNLPDDSVNVANEINRQFQASNKCITGDLGFLIKDFNVAVSSYSAAYMAEPEDVDIQEQYIEVQTRSVKHIAETLRAENGMSAQEVEGIIKNVVLDLSDPEALFGIGFLYQKVGWLDAASGKYQEALRLDPGNYMVRNNLAVIYDRKGWTQKALEELEIVIGNDPPMAEPYAYSGFIHEKLGDINRAVEMYERALEINPNHRSAREHLDRLR